MAIVKFSRVISCSSEDPKYPANNLVKLDVSGRWKCKDPGEKQAVVILELEKACKIQSIDIGNENSAFVEIFVGKSAVPDSYEVLRVASLLMSVQDSKNETNKNAVRFFKREEFSKPAVDQAWDRIKITCNQPYNKNVQYGLSFVRIHSTEITNDEKPTAQKKVDDDTTEQNTGGLKLGKFTLKKEEDEIDDVAVGSLFARRKDEPLSAAAAIRAASNNPNTLASPAPLKRLSDLIPSSKNVKRKRKTNSDDVPDSDDCRKSITGPLLYTGGLSNDEDNQEDVRLKKRDANATKENSKNKLNAHEDSKQGKAKKDLAKAAVSSLLPKTPCRGSASSLSSKQDQINKRQKKKPFNRLLEGVAFVLSGYQNPYRSELRSKALSMGAQYKADWSSSCTHLICAFANTPKSAQVRGNGWIVRNSWIEDCHKLRKRLPCANYKLDKNDSFTGPSDEEIWEDTEDETPSQSPKQAKRLEVQQLNNSCSSGDSPVPVSSESKTKEENVYDADTDIDSDYSNTVVQCSYESITLKVLPDLFCDLTFYFGSDLPERRSNMLHRYIVAYKGAVTDDVDESNYIISEDIRYKENTTDTPVLLPDWIWECNDKKKLIPTTHYLL